MQAALSLLLGGNVCSGRVAARNLATFLCFFTFETVSSLSFFGSCETVVPLSSSILRG